MNSMILGTVWLLCVLSGSDAVLFRMATSSSESCADVCGKYSTCSDKTHKFSCQHAATMACGSLDSFKRYTYDPDCNFDGCLASCSRGIYAINDPTTPLQCNVEPACVYEDVWARVCVCEDPTTSEMTSYDIFELVAIAFCFVVSIAIITIYGKPLVIDAYKWWLEKNQYKPLDQQSTHSGSISLSPMPSAEKQKNMYRAAPNKKPTAPLPTLHKPSPNNRPSPITPNRSTMPSGPSQASPIDDKPRGPPRKTPTRPIRDICDDI